MQEGTHTGCTWAPLHFSLGFMCLLGSSSVVALLSLQPQRGHLQNKIQGVEMFLWMKADIYALKGLHLHHYPAVRLITPAWHEAVFLSVYERVVSHESSVFYRKLIWHLVFQFMCLCSDGKPLDVHWQTHTHTPFLDKPGLYFSHPGQENTGLNKDWITKPCEAFSWPQSLHIGIHFPFSAAPGL